MAVTTQDVVPFLTHVFITRVGYITMVLLKLVQFQGPTPYKKKQEQSFLPVKFLVFAGETPTVCFLDKLRCFPTNCYTLCGA
jgi:hypothetical protein